MVNLGEGSKGDASYRIVKTIVEEGVEQMGYFLLLISSSEYLHDALIHRRGGVAHGAWVDSKGA